MRENQTVEWKESWRDEYLKWICGFANAEGGVLVIGRNDKGVTVGVGNAEKLLEDLPNKIRDVLGIMADVRLVKEAGKELVEVRVAPYPSPVSYRGEYHYRSGSTKQELKGAALDRFILRKYGRTWDSAPFPHVAVRDLSKAAMALFKKLARQSRRLDPELLRGSAATLVEKLNLVEGSYLKRAALLLFHPEPDRFFTGAFVKIGYFRGEVDLIYQDEIHGDLFTQTQQIMELLLTKYLKAAISYQGLQRIESYPVPREALRETLLNALIHRDYANTAPIQIRVYDNRLCIWNPGVLPESWTVRKLFSQHSSCPYNPLVANAFFRAGEIEAWGRGMQRILDACEEAGTPKPTVTYDPSDLWFEFPFSSEYLRIIATPAEPAGPRERTGEKTGEKSREKSREKSGEKSREKNAERLLALIRHNATVTTEELATALGLSRAGVDKIISRLKKIGSLRRVGPDKGGHWEVHP
jgi:ATP-dependent DNA helicase RecG